MSFSYIITRHIDMKMSHRKILKSWFFSCCLLLFFFLANIKNIPGDIEAIDQDIL